MIAEKESTGFGRRHYRPIYVMHKWWARRLGSVFRTILLYTLADKSLEGWDQKAQSLWEYYPEDVSFDEKVILDPMMGGGTTLFEALRFGCKVVGGDINPVAWFVVKKEVEDIDPQRIRKALEKLANELGRDLREYYRTRCPVCQKQAEAMYYFYTKEVTCSRCKQIVPLLKSHFLSKSPRGGGDVVICPHCWEIFTTDSADKIASCRSCQTEFIAKKSGYVEGQNFYCPTRDCTPMRIVDHIREHGRPDERMYAIEFYCKSCDKNDNQHLKHGRGYKKPDDGDFTLLSLAKNEYKRLKKDLPIPATAIPKGVETQRALNHGYRLFKDMFNERQLLNLGRIFKWILELSDSNLREFLVLAFSNCLKYNNTFCKYNGTRGFITDLFRTHSLSPSMAPVECNCYDIPKGRGAFASFVQLVIEGKEYCRNPFERWLKKGEMIKIESRRPIEGTIASRFDELGNDRNVLLRCGSSQNLDLPDCSVDAIVTDPPYVDNVMYSELSNFFYVWLRIALANHYDFFHQDLVPWKEEVIANRVQKKTKTEYLQELRGVFLEAHRVLKDDGLLVFTFHHRDIEAWTSVLQAVLDSGFFIASMHPVRSEMETSTHLYEKRNIRYDAVIVCRKREGKPERICWSDLMTKIKGEVEVIVEKLQTVDQEFSQQDFFAIASGKALESYSQHHRNVVSENREVKVSEIMKYIQELTSQYTSNRRGNYSQSKENAKE